jgi:hypothetical protein
MAERFEKTADYRLAEYVSSVGCVEPGCECDSIYVRLHDEKERLFASGKLTPDQARILASELLADAEKVGANVARRTGQPVAGHA